MLRKLLLSFLFVAFFASQAFAQTGSITGTVTDENGEPVPTANVLLVEISRGAATNLQGEYTINDVKPGTYTLRVSFIGYKEYRTRVTIEPGQELQKNVTLQPSVFDLEELVVTGVAEGTSKKMLSITVGTVQSDDIEKVPANNVSQALQGKMPGVSIISGGGSPGQAAGIDIRGVTAIGGSGGADQGPLVIVDGVILDGTLADIPTQNIESIEVLKGAAAASYYGSRAANGVIQIFTKDGSNLLKGATRVTIRNSVGTSWLGKRIDLANHHYYARTAQQLIAAGKDPADFTMDPTGSYMIDAAGNRVATADLIVDQPYGRLYDQVDLIFDPGVTMNNFVSVARNTGNGNYSISFSNLKEPGVILLKDGYSRKNVRVNLNQRIREKIEVRASASYSVSTNDLVSQGPGSPFWKALFQEPNFDLTSKNEEDGTPYNVNVNRYSEEGNPLYELANADDQRDRNRFLGSLQVEYNPINEITIEGSYSMDRANQISSSYTHKGYLSSNGAAAPTVSEGSLDRSMYENIAQNASLTGTFRKQFADLNVRFRASYLYENSHYQSFGATGSRFAIGGIRSWEAVSADGTKSLDNFTSDVISENIFGVVSLQYKGRYIADALIRRDGSSLFGADERYNMYFRVSGAYRISEDFDIPGINELKIHAAYGTAGLRPSFEAQYLTYNLNGGNPSKGTLGNPDLKPALAKELELGINLDFLARFSFMANYSTTTVEDQILRVPLGATGGGFSAKWENAGTLESHTIEAMLNVRAVQTQDLSIGFNIIFDRTRQKITELDVPPFFMGPDTQNSSIFYIAEGQTYGIMYGNRWVTSLDQLSTAQKNSGTKYKVNEYGYVVTDIGTPKEAPVTYEDETGNKVFKVGDVNPDFNLGLSSNIGYKGFNLYFLVDAKIGGDIYNQTRAWLYRDARHGDVDQVGVPADKRKPVGYFQAFYNANVTNSYFVEDGTYIKLREVSLGYEFTQDQLGSFGNIFRSISISVIGRNLITLTGYSGYDPEVAGIGGDITTFAFDGYSYPNFQSVSGVLELTF